MVADFHLENIKSTQEMLQVISLIGDLMADQLTLFHLGERDYAHKINPRPPGFSDLPAALKLKWIPAWLLI